MRSADARWPAGRPRWLRRLLQAGERQQREATWSDEAPDGRWRPYSLDEILARDKVSLDLFWLRDESLEDSAKLPEPHILAEEIADDLRTALEQIESVLGDLQSRMRAPAGSDLQMAE